MADKKPDEQDISSDHEERIDDFLGRHGGRGKPRRSQESEGGDSGWFEVYAADGYRLRCEWSRIGSREEMTFTEAPP
jgi:hypothetical protein